MGEELISATGGEKLLHLFGLFENGGRVTAISTTKKTCLSPISVDSISVTGREH